MENSKETKNIQKSASKMTPKELIREVERLNEQLQIKDNEIEQQKSTIKKLTEIGSERDEIIELRKKANEARDRAIRQADDIIREARETARKLIERAKESALVMQSGKDEFVLPGSKNLVIGDELLKSGSGSGKPEPDAVKHTVENKIDRIMDEYLGGYKNR